MTGATLPTLGTVLCPVDLSEESRSALYFAGGMTHTPDSRLVVLRVDARAASEQQDDLLAARHELDAFVRRTLPGWLAYRAGTEQVVAGGDTAAAILAAARDLRADLIVMGTKGRGALARAVLGSTTARLLRETTVPVAVLPPTRPELVSLLEDRAGFHFGLVLVPVDLGADLERQLGWAGKLSGGSGHHLLLVHVIPAGGDRDLAMERLNATARDMTTARGVKLHVRQGRAVDEVIHVAKRDGAGLVIMGRSSDAPGAMAYEVLRHTNATVVMVP